jgi:hypothetical protein
MTRRDAQLNASALQQLRCLRYLTRHDAHLLANAVRGVV